MKQRTIAITIVITSLALIGVIVTQLYWVNNAVQLKNEQFKQKVNLGLNKIVNQLLTLQNDSVLLEKYKLDNGDSFTNHIKFIHAIQPQLIDSIINSEFFHLSQHANFYYGIYEEEGSHFLLGNYAGFQDEILNSQHNIAVSCIFQPETYWLGIYFPFQSSYVFKKMQANIIMSAFFMLVIIGSFWFVIYSLFRQKKLSEIKTDFVNNMTHEFKTPISTISVASEMLFKEYVIEDKNMVTKYARVIFDENARLKDQVEKVLQVATLEKGDYRLKLKSIDVHALLNDTIRNFEVAVSQRNGKIFSRLNAANSTILADRGHFNNVVITILDNANKYSADAPDITVSTRSNSKGIVVSIEDKGIGMAREHQANIFKRFHRIPTGNVHNVKGFGIGLFYVKTVVEAHGGHVSVSSDLGKGSRFDVFFPFHAKLNKTNVETENPEK
jgi:two-component system phosphate regulon sensor histidine kinase PhoR